MGSCRVLWPWDFEVGRGEGHPSAERQHGGREASRGLEQGGPGGAGPSFTLEAASAVATRVDPGRVVVADAPHHAPAVGFHHPQVAAYLPPEPAVWGGRRARPAGLSGLVPSLRSLPGLLFDSALVSSDRLD